MIRYLFYIGAVFLIADHVYTHWGTEIINWVASKLSGEQVTVVEGTPHRESVIDKVVKTVREKIEDLRR